jgi:hypothetical protein
VFFDSAAAYMFPNCASEKPATSQNCDAAQADEDIRRSRHNLSRARRTELES